MATVRIPPVLRPAVGGEKELTADGSSVGEILRSVAESHPETQSQLFAADGGLNRYVNVYLNDEDVRVLDGLDTAVGESDTLVILPAMAGGLALSARRTWPPLRKGCAPGRRLRDSGRVHHLKGARCLVTSTEGQPECVVAIRSVAMLLAGLAGFALAR